MRNASKNVPSIPVFSHMISSVVRERIGLLLEPASPQKNMAIHWREYSVYPMTYQWCSTWNGSCPESGNYPTSAQVFRARWARELL